MRNHSSRTFRPRPYLGGLLSFGGALALTSALAACHPASEGVKGAHDVADVATLAEAQAIVDEARSQHGVTSVGTAPKSLAETFEVLRHDQSERFGATRDFLATVDGVDALSVRAALESLWADGQLIVAALAREHAKRLENTVTTLQQTLKLQPGDASLQARIEETQRGAARERRLAMALSKLAEPHYEAGLSLAREVVRRDPQRADGHGTLANLFRLHGKWNDFERSLGKAEAQGEDRAAVTYARAMELAQRVGDRDRARRALEALLAEHPDIARARAQLVLLEDDVGQRYEQLKKLEAINPHHALIALEGQAIEREYQTASEVRGARQGASSTAAPAPTPTTKP